MKQTLRSRTSSASAIRACAIGALLASSAGCGESDKKNSTCAPGSEACPCYGNRTCNGSLTCASDLCVDLTGGDAGATGGRSSTGGTRNADSQGGSTASTANTGGDGPSGGALSAGGTTNGLSLNTGGGQNVGGASNAGGLVSVGGDSASGGTQTMGGVTNAGGEPPIGGSVATGGTSATTGTSGGGQNPTAGGASSVGGMAASGGAATGGQSAATGGSSAGTCGNGIVEPWEGCDPQPHDNNLGDGCTPLCKVEPDCPAAGGCTTRCGDGFVLGDETCDDANTVGGDGCSSTCQTEPEFDCAEPALPNSIVVPMVVRDFAAGGDFEKGPPFNAGLIHATQGLLKPLLNDKGKPELASTTGTYAGQAGNPSGISSFASFAQWYDDAAISSGNTRTGTLAVGLTLFSGATDGEYANRWGANGEQWIRESDYADHWCGAESVAQKDPAGNPIPCTYCPLDDPSTPECENPQPNDCRNIPDMIRCETRAGSYYGIYEVGRFDGTPLFFPADAMTPASPSSLAEIPAYYGKYWSLEPSGVKHNFSFTTEVRFWFKYDASQELTLSFTGDDDAWVFVNKRLAIDLGGIHAPVSGQMVVNTDGVATTRVSATEETSSAPIETKVNLGLENGRLYEVAVFQAERQTTASSYALTFNGFHAAPSVCTRR